MFHRQASVSKEETGSMTQRLLLHFDILQDYESKSTHYTTLALLLASLYIQAVPTNNQQLTILGLF